MINEAQKKPVEVKTFLPFKTRNELKKTDYKRITELLPENPILPIELLPSADLASLKVLLILSVFNSCRLSACCG